MGFMKDLVGRFDTDSLDLWVQCDSCFYFSDFLAKLHDDSGHCTHSFRTATQKAQVDVRK